MMNDEAIKTLREDYCGNRIICELYPDQCNREDCEIWLAINALENAKNDNLTPESAQNVQNQAFKMQKTDVLGVKTGETCSDTISRQNVLRCLTDISYNQCKTQGEADAIDIAKTMVITMPSAQPERIWHSCGEPPKHHKNVLVRGIEAIGNVTVHKVMQWDVDRWRPTDYAPSIVWQEWSEI